MGALCRPHLGYVLHVKEAVEGHLHVSLRQHGGQGVAVPPQATEGASVAGPLRVGAEGGGGGGDTLRGRVGEASVSCVDTWICAADRSSITGVKSMVMRAGSPGMSGMRVVSRRRMFAPGAHTHTHTHTPQDAGPCGVTSVGC